MTVFLFIVILVLLVFVHELGHFSLAKYFGIRVDEFAIGFPPRILSKRIGETRYAINIVPFGGYVKIFGEDPEENISESPDRARSMPSKNRAVQAAVLGGGVAANFLFAWLLLSVLFMTGTPVSSDEYKGHALENERLLIVEIIADSPAADAGIRPGDSIVSLSDKKTELQSPTVTEVQDFIKAHGNEEIQVHILRAGEEKTIKVVPAEGVVGEAAGIGVSMQMSGTLKLPFFSAFVEGAKHTYALTLTISKALGKFLYDAFFFEANLMEVAGPVGIATIVGTAREMGLFYVVSFTALISLNLGIINLIPFPALDGGRLFFLLIEAVIRRPLPQKFVRTANSLGFIFLIALLIFVTYKDILRLL